MDYTILLRDIKTTLHSISEHSQQLIAEAQNELAAEHVEYLEVVLRAVVRMLTIIKIESTPYLAAVASEDAAQRQEGERLLKRAFMNDLRNPLSVIQGYVDLLIWDTEAYAPPLKETANAQLAEIQRLGNNLANLIEAGQTL